MIIKNIMLKNFRQYIDTTIEFATDADKNITVVMGDNGTGKTTLAQAFQWALYGETRFQIQEVINRIVREQMTMGQSKTVSVSIEIFYNEKNYTIKRSVTYKKNAQMKLEGTNHKFTISTIDENGELHYFDEGKKNYMIKQFLPKDLSRFFFFDGERIEEMSKEIQSGKSDDFREAVYSLVGLRATQNAMGHLKNTGNKMSVTKYYKNEIEKNNKSANAMADYNRKIEELQEDIDEKSKAAKEKREKLTKCKDEIAQCQKTIYSETPVMELKRQYEQLEREIINLKQKREQVIGKEFLQEFSKGFYAFCARPLVEEAEAGIKEEGAGEKCIPDLTQRMIYHLIQERKTCLCGTPLIEHTKEYAQLTGLLDYAQPKTIGMQINDYRSKEEDIRKQENTFMADMQRKMKYILDIEAQIVGKEQEAGDKMELLGNTSKGEAAKAKKKMLEAEYEKLHDGLVLVETAVKIRVQEKERQETEKAKLVLTNENSVRNANYLAYAEKLYEKLRDNYSKNENKYRILLEARMNGIFKTIYDGNIQISIDPKYRINVNIQEEFASHDEVEKNTAQGYALIFAFISAIIDLAKDKINHNAVEEDDMIDVEKEGYPLVMDAPLSAFDKTRIKSICTEIPKIADQVIIFIKDTDGDVAEEYMSSKIGKRYMVRKVDESSLHSEVIGR